jgi:hypothetical protein
MIIDTAELQRIPWTSSFWPICSGKGDFFFVQKFADPKSFPNLLGGSSREIGGNLTFCTFFPAQPPAIPMTSSPFGVVDFCLVP